MSLESDISSLKSDAKQLSKTNSDLARDVRQIKADVETIKKTDPGSFFKLVKGAALVSAISKINGLDEKISKLNKLADEKVKLAREARDAEAKRLVLAEEQDKRLKEEHETTIALARNEEKRRQKEHEYRLESEQKEREQSGYIAQFWIEYQKIQKEPDIMKRFFLISNQFGDEFGFDVSFVKDETMLKQYAELCTCHKTVLAEIKDSLGEQCFKALNDSQDLKDKLHAMAAITECSNSFIAAYEVLSERINQTQTLLPYLEFSTDERFSIAQRIDEYKHNSLLFSTLYHESKIANLVTDNVYSVLCKVASDYKIQQIDLSEILKLGYSFPVSKADWILFYDRAKKYLPDTYEEDLQSYYDFLSDRSEMEHIDLRQAYFRNILTWNIPGVVISDRVPFDMDTISQKILGFLPVAEDQFVVFLTKSLFWIDCRNRYFVHSTYISFSDEYPNHVKQLIRPVIIAISTLSFIENEDSVFPEWIVEWENRYREFLAEETNKNRLQQQPKYIIRQLCSSYAELNLKPRLHVSDDPSSEVIAETTKQELVITERGFTIKLSGLKSQSETLSWENFSKIRNELAISKVLRQVTLCGKITVLYAEHRYCELIHQIVNELYPLEEPSEPVR